MNGHTDNGRLLTLIVAGVYLIAIATLFVSSLRIFIGYDPFWHLQMGKDLIENGLSPRIDHYSFTYNGKEITSPPVGFQVLLYSLVNLLGEFNGFFVIRFGAFALTVAMMFLWLRQIRAPIWVHYLVIPMLPFLLQLRAIVRPELLSYSMAVLALILYQKAKLQLTFRAIWPVAMLLLIWVNLHSSIFGYIIFFGLFLDIAIRLLKERCPLKDWLVWGAWGSLLLIIGFLQPGGAHPVLQYLHFADEWKTLIGEYHSPSPLLSSPATWVLLPVTLATLALLAAQRKVGLLVVAVVFVYAGMTIARMVTPAGLVVLCLFAHVLTAPSLKSLLSSAPKMVGSGLIAIGVLAAITSMAVGISLARGYMRDNSMPVALFPYHLTEHMISSGMNGRIFNVYGIGGYLIYRLPRESQVYIDGRTEILYPVEHFLRHVDASTYADTFLEEVEQYDINYALLEASENRAALMADAGFHLEFVDIQYALWSREKAALSTSGKLWAKPFCWSKLSQTSLRFELDWAKEFLPPTAPILPLLELATSYANSTEHSGFFQHAQEIDTQSDSAIRFIGFRALESGHFAVAAEQFRNIKEKQPKDYLAEAMALLRQGDANAAENVLDLSTRKRWIQLDTSDILVQWALLREIAAVETLKLFDENYIRHLEEEVAQLPGSLPELPVTMAAFCAE